MIEYTFAVRWLLEYQGLYKPCLHLLWRGKFRLRCRRRQLHVSFEFIGLLYVTKFYYFYCYYL